MHIALRIGLHMAIALSAMAAAAQQTADTATIELRLYAMAFFDNKELTSNIKKGYTLPGFYLEPILGYGIGAFDLQAGIHTAHFAGSDTAKRLTPILLIGYTPTRWFKVQLGSLSRSQRGLPEPLYKPERVFAERPATGLELALNRPQVSGNMWINWERYIERGSPFQEEFMVGLSSQYSPNGYSSTSNPLGFSANLYAVVTHAGGQIDSTNLPVTSIANIGTMLAYGISIGTGTTFGASVAAYISADISPNPHIDYKRGHAAHYTLWLKALNGLTAQAGFWQAHSFINPRGEELFGSVSTVSKNFNQTHRHLITAQATYTRSPMHGFELRFAAGLYADLCQIKARSSQGAADYFYTLTIRFNGPLLGKRMAKTPPLP